MTATEPTPPAADEPRDEPAVAFMQQAYGSLRAQLGKVIVGQSEVIDEILIAIFTRNHALLMGVPGLGKTLLIATLAQTLSAL